MHGIYQCFRKAGPPDEGALREDDGNGHKTNHAPIIKKATSLIYNTDLRKGMQGHMERNYDASRYYATWRNELRSRANMLVPSNDNSERHQDRRRESRQDIDPRHRRVKRQQGESQRDVVQPAGKYFQGSVDDYSTFNEAELHKRLRLDGENYHSHEQYHTKHRGLASPPMCVHGASL